MSKKQTTKKTTPKKTFWVYEDLNGKEYISENYCVHTRKVQSTSLTGAKKLINKKDENI